LDFQTAVEFCAVRKMELMAFDTATEAQNRAWADTEYLNNYFNLSKLGKVKNKCNFFRVQNWVFLVTHEILWTSGVACSSKDPGKDKGKCKSATWCSTKKVTKVNHTLKRSKKKDENCLALDIKTKKLIVANCKNKGIAFCEVNLIRNSTTGFIFYIFSPNVRNPIART